MKTSYINQVLTLSTRSGFNCEFAWSLQFLIGVERFFRGICIHIGPFQIFISFYKKEDNDD